MDEKVFLWINALAGANPLADQLILWMASDYLIPVSMAFVLVGMWFAGQDVQARRHYQIGVLWALATMGLSNLVVLISNSIYERDRPYLDLDVTLLLYTPTEYSSFPSNAAAAVFGIAFAVALVNRKLGSILIVAATVYGLSRIYVGVHYPIDVLAGMTIALFVSRFVLLVRPFVQSILDRFLTVARVFCLA